MYKSINIKQKEDAIKALYGFKEKEYSPIDIRFTNTNLRKINTLIGKDIFLKNDLFVNSDTLHDIMQPIGGKRVHNFHGLTPEEILQVLNNLTNPYCIYKTKENRYGIVSTIHRKSGETIIIIVEVGSGLIGQMDANINKFVTMYPKTDIGNIISNKESILYLNINL